MAIPACPSCWITYNLTSTAIQLQPISPLLTAQVLPDTPVAGSSRRVILPFSASLHAAAAGSCAGYSHGMLFRMEVHWKPSEPGRMGMRSRMRLVMRHACMRPTTAARTSHAARFMAQPRCCGERLRHSQGSKHVGSPGCLCTSEWQQHNGEQQQCCRQRPLCSHGWTHNLSHVCDKQARVCIPICRVSSGNLFRHLLIDIRLAWRHRRRPAAPPGTSASKSPKGGEQETAP